MEYVEKTPKQIITKQKFCEICGISQSTAYKLIKNKKIKIEKCRDGLLHYYNIPVSEVNRYIAEKNSRKELTDSQIRQFRMYYSKKMSKYDDVIEAKDIRVITGYGKEAIRNWINSEKILGVVCRGKFRVAKEDLLDFLTSPYYFNITRKSKTHIEDLEKLGGFKNG